MRKALTLCCLFLSLCVWAQEKPRQSFDKLKKAKLLNAGIEFWYDPAVTTISDVAIKNAGESLSDEVRCFTEDEYIVAHGYVVAKTLIAPADTCYVVYVAGWDEGFRFCRPRAEKELGALWAHGLLVVPGTGAVYTSHHRNNFTARRKYELVNDSLVEVQQPYLYVGLKSKTLKEVKIYDTKEKSKLIATLPLGYEIEVLLAETDIFDGGKGFYLVRTSFGLCGWAELAVAQGEAVDVEGLMYLSD